MDFQPYPLSLHTLYADLIQKLAEPVPAKPGSIYRRTQGGSDYLYAERRRGSRNERVYLGRAVDPATTGLAEEIRRQAVYAKERRKIVSTLRRSGFPGPDVLVGRVLEALSDRGLFDRGLVLVGTIAFQIYPAVLGYRLGSSVLATQDADIVAATTRIAMATGDAAASPGDPDSFLECLQQADASFRGAPNLDPKAPPSRFLTERGFDVEVLTPTRTRQDRNPVPLPGLRAGAIPLQFLEYLIEDAEPAVALHGAGVRVTIPRPERYAVHKLIVAQKRPATSPKVRKDLDQSSALIRVLGDLRPDDLADAFEDARARGQGWRDPIEASLRALGLANI